MIRAGKDVPAQLQGFDPFRFVPQGNAGNFQPIGFFLHAAGVGKEKTGGFFQGDDVEIADGIDDFEAKGDG